MSRHNFETRLPPAFALFVALAVVVLLPMHVALLPEYGRAALAGLALVPTFAVMLTGGTRRSLALERVAHLAFCSLLLLVTLLAVAQLIYMMVERSSELSGIALLSSSIAVWLVNIVNHSLLYWHLDRGGPEARLRGVVVRPDWMFPQDGLSTDLVKPRWRPSFVDYLYLAYETATAFSTTEVAPITQRAKLLMMAESSISLMVIVLVGARAINILGS